MAAITKDLPWEVADLCRADLTRAVSEMRGAFRSTAVHPLRWTVAGSPGSQPAMVVGEGRPVGGGEALVVLEFESTTADTLCPS